MAIMSPMTLPTYSSGAEIRTFCMGSKRVLPVCCKPFITAMGVAKKKSRGWVWMVWCSPPTSVTFKSVTSQLYKPCLSARGKAVSMWF